VTGERARGPRRVPSSARLTRRRFLLGENESALRNEDVPLPCGERPGTGCRSGGFPARDVSGAAVFKLLSGLFPDERTWDAPIDSRGMILSQEAPAARFSPVGNTRVRPPETGSKMRALERNPALPDTAAGSPRPPAGPPLPAQSASASPWRRCRPPVADCRRAVRANRPRQPPDRPAGPRCCGRPFAVVQRENAAGGPCRGRRLAKRLSMLPQQCLTRNEITCQELRIMAITYTP
jgi:hypothetical protein